MLESHPVEKSEGPLRRGRTGELWFSALRSPDLMLHGLRRWTWTQAVLASAKSGNPSKDSGRFWEGDDAQLWGAECRIRTLQLKTF